MNPVLRTIQVLSICMGLGACASAPQTKALLDDRAALDLPKTALIDPVPFIPQETNYCGPAALAMAAGATGPMLEQAEAADLVYTEGRAGTLRSDMTAGVRRIGRLGVPVNSMKALLTELSAGNPVIVFQNLALDMAPQWHYAVAIGYDLGSAELILHSGTIKAKRVGLSTFERTWSRADKWALVITPPGRLPATGGESETIQAAAGLEQAGRAHAARAAFAAVTARWPDNPFGFMGLGNAWFALEDLEKAEAAFRRAADLVPDQPEPWNNLAYVLAAQGKGDAALAAVDKAIALSDGAAMFKDSRTEILSMFPDLAA